VAEQPGALVRYLPLIAALFGAEEYEGAHQVYPHVSRLRRKLRGAAGPEAEGWIVTLRGVGVRLALEPRQVRLRRSAACQAV
jgi:DNA-binding response OmpR family regulator